MTTPSPTTIGRRPWWPWVILGLGLIWTVVLRVPLILNAEDHLDSDLAVDGLTLLDAVNGQWRWHYPGTPFIGILPMLLSYPQAVVWGANPITLVSGGTVIWVLVVGSTFWLAWKAFGPAVAGWSIVPLVFSSLGTIWLSGRITGGHLLTLVWHTMAFAGLHACLTRGGWQWAVALGTWCGLGLYLDAMFLFTLAGLVPAAVLAWLLGARSRSALGSAAAFLAGMMIGLLPRAIGQWVDPYDAYPSQFTATFQPSAILGHARLLMLRCLPRLIAGPELSEFDRQLPRDGTLGEELLRFLYTGGNSWVMPPWTEWLAIVLVLGFLVAFVRVVRDPARAIEPARRAVGRGTILSSLAIVAGFLVNRNIYNSDNYRYLIFLLTPWALGFGLLMNDLARQRWFGVLAAWVVAAILAEVMTATTFLWYRDECLYVDRSGLPVCSRPPAWSELVVVLWAPGRHGALIRGTTKFTVPSDVTHILGGYWDVYRMAFLSGKRVVGIPLSMYPNRFPGWSRGLGAGQGRLLVLFPYESEAPRSASTMGARGMPKVWSARGEHWRSALLTPWMLDGRDPAELDRLRVVVVP
ncbi:MAG TPA: hypothetical protein VFF52_24450 [Isosphaeraceae bacterium]|nr:hypothetical protein [Isosphaeraceae bacterium]